MTVLTTAAAGWPVGKVLISAGSLFTGIGAFAADWSPTHLLNPDWTPHAKFHTAQTMSIAASLALLSLTELWWPGRGSLSRLRRATVLASLYWLTQIPSVFFPGSEVVDPDTPTQPFTVLGFVPVNQITAIGAILVPLLTSGYLLERRRLIRLAAVSSPPA